jgi:hypothetical protein
VDDDDSAVALFVIIRREGTLSAKLAPPPAPTNGVHDCSAINGRMYPPFGNTQHVATLSFLQSLRAWLPLHSENMPRLLVNVRVLLTVGHVDSVGRAEAQGVSSFRNPLAPLEVVRRPSTGRAP